jgi:hypothetical protein
MTSLEPFAGRLGVAFVPVDFGSAAELDQAFDRIAGDDLKAVLVIAGSLTFVNGRRIVELALARSCQPALVFAKPLSLVAS